MDQSAAMQKSCIEGVTLLAAWPAHELEGMHQAAKRLIVSGSALAEAGQTVLSALIQGEEAVEAWTHYPVRDVIVRPAAPKSTITPIQNTIRGAHPTTRRAH
jgi:hypothetical protein